MPQTIQMIEVSRIDPHKNNPRKNLGDLTEFAEGIKASGILQNLTIVPQDAEEYNKKIEQKKKYTGRYTVIIGHRRHGGAKLAGLSEVPCSIVIMSEKEQIATMLQENIQREDLTPIEQAHGFQMMLDLGDTVSEIVHKTGFSKNKVYKRLNLNKLDQKKLEKASERGGTLSDYAELEKINDIKKRNEVLDSIGTNNFDWKLKAAIKEELIEKNKPAMLEVLKSFATEIKSNATHKYSYEKIVNFDSIEVEKFKKPKDAGKVKYFYCDYNSYFHLYKENENATKKTDEKLAEQQRRQRQFKKAIKSAFRQAYELRLDFAKNFKYSPKTELDVVQIAVDVIMSEDNKIKEDIFKDFYGITEQFRKSWQDGENETFSEALERVKGESVQYHVKLFRGAYLNMEEGAEMMCTDYNVIEYRKNANLEKLYKNLEAVGYDMSDDEKALLDGTHELYKSEE